MRPVEADSSNTRPRWQRGLYAITAQTDSVSALRNDVAAALAGGAVLVQYRDKSHNRKLRLQQASALAEICHAAQVPLLINDDIDLCLAVQAAGVHLGKDDAELAQARHRLGDQAIIGASCYADMQRAATAAAAGADYLAFGSFFPSLSKPAAPPCPPSLLKQARSWQLPVVAIGGINTENGSALIHHGADLLAVISDLFGAADIAAQAARYRKLFQHHEQ
ncbi:MAG: thiamine phosphate synthase [Wenzhouxiangellaceae bacterium]